MSFNVIYQLRSLWNLITLTNIKPQLQWVASQKRQLIVLRAPHKAGSNDPPIYGPCLTIPQLVGDISQCYPAFLFNYPSYTGATDWQPIRLHIARQFSKLFTRIIYYTCNTLSVYLSPLRLETVVVLISLTLIYVCSSVVKSNSSLPVKHNQYYNNII